MEYTIIDNNRANNFLNYYFDQKYINAFFPGDTKFKADLLRFCIMSKYKGLYSDVDLMCTNNINNIVNDVDTIMVIGAHTPTYGILPLPKGELAIGFIKCNSPEPLFIEYITSMTPEKVSSGAPYAINIQGLYIFLCNRWNIDEIQPYKKYLDPLSKRIFYFLKETKTPNGYKIYNEKKVIVIHSQYFKPEIFY